jgi:hypothetical protein
MNVQLQNGGYDCGLFFCICHCSGLAEFSQEKNFFFQTRHTEEAFILKQREQCHDNVATKTDE